MQVQGAGPLLSQIRYQPTALELHVYQGDLQLVSHMLHCIGIASMGIHQAAISEPPAYHRCCKHHGPTMLAYLAYHVAQVVAERRPWFGMAHLVWLGLVVAELDEDHVTRTEIFQNLLESSLVENLFGTTAIDRTVEDRPIRR